MIVSFYDESFRGLQNNASLVVDKSSYKLIKRPVDMNDLSCICEPFTENIQPTFLVIKDDKGGYIYGSLAGIPILNENNQTEINGTDLKSMLSSDVILEFGTYSSVNEIITYIFNEWNKQVNQNSFNCFLVFNDNVGTISLKDLVPNTEKGVYNAWEVLQSYLKYYDLFLDTKINLIPNQKGVYFYVGRTMYRQFNVKLWEYGIRNYGKWVADTNETQGYYIDENGVWNEGYKWILTSENNITLDESKRDIYPIKRRIITNEESLLKANEESLTELLNSLYNENIEVSAENLNSFIDSMIERFKVSDKEEYKARLGFETSFAVYLKEQKRYETIKGSKYYSSSDLSEEIGTLQEKVDATFVNTNYAIVEINNNTYFVAYNDIKLKPYKYLPCGELQYNSNGLEKVQIGYRYSDINFI